MEQRTRPGDATVKAALIGTYLPRKCGIATFTSDLTEALVATGAGSKSWAVAINDQPEGYRYPSRVKFEIHQNRRSDYRLAADFLNMGQADVVCLQHEYGIFGGPDGQYIIDLLQQLRMPVVTTLHTILEEPTSQQRDMLSQVAELSDRMVVMAELGVAFLKDVYGVPEQKIAHIPHGIPDVPFIDPNYYKEQFNIEGKRVILTFGLLSPNKGIESMIDALPEVIKSQPDVVYIVLGATHPHVQASSGQDYRKSLQRRAAANGVASHVIFHNRFVELSELCEFLGVADIYVTPYLSQEQIVSGTLAYALGTGNAVVSTPYCYAQEMLAENRGQIVPFRDSQALAQAITKLFDNEVERHAMRKRAYSFTRKMIWSAVAKQYMDLFADVAQNHRQRSNSAVLLDHAEQLRPQRRSNIKLDHLRTLTDDTGILQHARGTVPNRSHGYCTDDNARALIVSLLVQDHLTGVNDCAVLTGRYLSFLHDAFNLDVGRFRNFMGYDRHWQEEIGSEDSHGRALWALGETVARSDLRGHVSLACELFHQAIPATLAFEHCRAWSYSLIGIHAYLRQFGGDTEVRRTRDELSQKLLVQFNQHATEDWPWPEDQLTYANARIPHALLLAGQWMFDQHMVDLALRALGWLADIQTSEAGYFVPIGNKGWYLKNQVQSRFDQQPIEAACMVDACLEAARATGDEHWVNRANQALGWFLGANDLQIPLIDAGCGGCADGLHPHGVNENHGAESTLVWLSAALATREFSAQRTPTKKCKPIEVVSRLHSQTGKSVTPT